MMPAFTNVAPNRTVKVSAMVANAFFIFFSKGFNFRLQMARLLCTITMAVPRSGPPRRVTISYINPTV